MAVIAYLARLCGERNNQRKDRFTADQPGYGFIVSSFHGWFVCSGWQARTGRLPDCED